VLASVFMVVTLSSIGLPGLNGFVGEVLVLVGTFARNRAFAAVAALGMILGAVYMLWMYQRVFLGKVTDPANAAMTDLGPREKIILIPIMLMMLWMGVYSAPFLRRMDASIARLQERVEDARGSGGTYRVQRLNGNLTAGERAR
jgi:NADH-quinone oxidoreductase subunit M